MEQEWPEQKDAAFLDGTRYLPEPNCQELRQQLRGRLDKVLAFLD